jgi:hypothetical protein
MESSWKCLVCGQLFGFKRPLDPYYDTTTNCPKCTLKYYISKCTKCSKRIITADIGISVCPKGCNVCNVCESILENYDNGSHCTPCIKKSREYAAALFRGGGAMSHNAQFEFLQGSLIDISRKVYKIEERLIEQQKSIEDNIVSLTQKLDQLFLYHPVFGSEIPKLAASFTEKANI